MAEIDANPRKAERIRLPLRFGMRTLLILVAVLSVPLGVFSREMLRLRHQRVVAARCTGNGTMFVYDYQFGGPSGGWQPSWVTKKLRNWFGADVFADVSQVQWDYTYHEIDGEALEIAADGLPAVRDVSFVGPSTYSGRAPMPWDAPLPEEETRQYGERQAAAFGRLAGCKRLTRMLLYGGFATNQHLARFKDGGNLQSLEIVCAPNVSDEGALAIAAYKHLEHLRLSEVPHVTDAGAVYFKLLTGLKSLDLSGTAITDATLVEIAQLGHLERLGLRQCAITDEGLRALSTLRRLRQLDVSFSKITDAGLPVLGLLPVLEELDLSGTQITDAGLDNLRCLTQVATLSLAGTAITDEGLMKFADSAALRRFHVTVRQRVSLEGVRRLKASLPECLFECSSYDAARGTTILDAWE